MVQKLPKCNRETNDVIFAIVKRLRAECPAMKFDAPLLATDLTLCHKLGHVDLAVLLDAEVVNFVHDLLGIHQHLDRETGELNRFLPRCRKLEAVQA